MVNLSAWEKESFYKPADVIIVGAGLMGLWTATHLLAKAPNLSITIIERNTTPLGASTRNAGFACFGSPTELMYDLEQVGKDEMLRIVEMRVKGIELLQKSFHPEQIGWDPCGGYECVSASSRYWPAFDDRVSQLNKLLKDITGQRSIFRYAGHKMTDMGLQGFDLMVENQTEAAIHSGKLVQALTQQLQQRVTLLNGYEMRSFDRAPHGWMLSDALGREINAKELIFCTNAFTSELIPELGVQPARGQIILTHPIPELPMRGTFHYDEGFYYWRNLGNRILLGGARNTSFDTEKTLDMSGSTLIRDTLIQFLTKHLHPSLSFSIDQSWSGIMGFTETKRPIMGTSTKGIHYGIACNGMGVALTPIIGQQLADRVLSYF